MNDVQIFDNEEFGSIRTVVIDGEPWFVGKDVAGALGYGGSNAESRALTNAIKDHVDDEDKRLIPYQEFKGYQNGDLKNISHYGATIINESGLYSLILSSKLPSAKKFKRWITSEVLPAIRRTGHYEAPAVQSTLKASSISEVVAMGKFVKDLLKMQGANAYQVADAVIEVSKEIGFGLSDKFLLPVKLDKVKKDELDMVEFKLTYPESTYQEYIAYRTLLKLAEK